MVVKIPSEHPLTAAQFNSERGRYQDFVTQAIREAQAAGARGTPTFFINGQLVYPSYTAMYETIRSVLNN